MRMKKLLLIVLLVFVVGLAQEAKIYPIKLQDSIYYQSPSHLPDFHEFCIYAGANEYTISAKDIDQMTKEEARDLGTLVFILTGTIYSDKMIEAVCQKFLPRWILVRQLAD